jgi:hypothetical protein
MDCCGGFPGMVLSDPLAALGPEDVLASEGVPGVQGQTVVEYVEYFHVRGMRCAGCGMRRGGSSLYHTGLLFRGQLT